MYQKSRYFGLCSKLALTILIKFAVKVVFISIFQPANTACPKKFGFGYFYFPPKAGKYIKGLSVSVCVSVSQKTMKALRDFVSETICQIFLDAIFSNFLDIVSGQHIFRFFWI